MAKVFRDVLMAAVHGLDFGQQRTRLSRTGGLAILDFWLATTGALALVPMMASVEDFAWSWVLLAFVVSSSIQPTRLHDFTFTRAGCSHLKDYQSFSNAT